MSNRLVKFTIQVYNSSLQVYRSNRLVKFTYLMGHILCRFYGLCFRFMFTVEFTSQLYMLCL